MSDAPTNFELGKWYCLHCLLHPANGDNRFFGEFGVRQHLEKSHDYVAPTKGKDYCEGWQARKIFLGREIEGIEQSHRAARALIQPGYTVEDFLTDCGDELWDRRGE